MANVTNHSEEMQSDSNKEKTTTDNIISTSTVNGIKTESEILGNVNSSTYKTM